jgi:hypothetical protein
LDHTEDYGHRTLSYPSSRLFAPLTAAPSTASKAAARSLSSKLPLKKLCLQAHPFHEKMEKDNRYQNTM